MPEYRQIIPEAKQKHMFAVAEHMGKYADEYGLDPDRMYFLGLVHDIGYIGGGEKHEKFGADLLRACGVNERLVYAVEHHGDDLKKLEKKRGFVPADLILLVAADMTYGADGVNLGFDGRLEELRGKYDDITTAESNVAFLKDYYEHYMPSEPEQREQKPGSLRRRKHG